MGRKNQKLNWFKDCPSFTTAKVDKNVFCDILEANEHSFLWGVHDRRVKPESMIFSGETNTLERAKRACEMALMAPTNFAISSVGAPA